ncbi:MAG: L,D-transpeptidase [Spirulinaceae cyanobacterium SM2_1_0]|nr:L,D-transpeptidase [Spirulinaceae cyanobacterium SM2_1_0]
MTRLNRQAGRASCHRGGTSLGILAVCLLLGQPLLATAQPAADSQAELFSAGLSPDVPPLGEAARFLPERQQRLILRLEDRRVYLYEGDIVVASYPVAVGRTGWETPTGSFAIFQKVQDPSWQHPFTKEIFPPGPGNPLGNRWIGFWTDGENFIGFHGTPNEELIGQAVSHGCVRMRNDDIADLFERVAMGTPVIVER